MPVRCGCRSKPRGEPNQQELGREHKRQDCTHSMRQLHVRWTSSAFINEHLLRTPTQARIARTVQAQYPLRWLKGVKQTQL